MSLLLEEVMLARKHVLDLLGLAPEQPSSLQNSIISECVPAIQVLGVLEKVQC